MTSPLIYVESCPICGDGLCRIRICITNQRLTGLVLCDECEAMWTDPSMQKRIESSNSESEPSCPTCKQSLWGDQAHWASIGEVCLLGWFDRVRIAKV